MSNVKSLVATDKKNPMNVNQKSTNVNNFQLHFNLQFSRHIC